MPGIEEADNPPSNINKRDRKKERPNQSLFSLAKGLKKGKPRKTEDFR